MGAECAKSVCCCCYCHNRFCGCCCAKEEEKLFGKEERHNPEGTGPSGKVFEDPKSGKTNMDVADGKQEQKFPEPEQRKIDNPDFNPDAYKMVPKVVEKPADPQNPEAGVIIEGKMSDKPIGLKDRVVEEEEAKKKRLEEQRIREQEELEAIKKRTQDATLKLIEETRVPVNNELTNNKPIPPPTPVVETKPNQVYQTPVAEAKPAAPVLADDSAFGLPPRKIPGIDKTSIDCFPDDDQSDKTQYASNEITIPDSKWQELHKGINGEFYDKEFPATVKSLVGTGKADNADDSKKLNDMQSYTFKRLSYILEKVEVIKGDVNPQDIYQGGLGNCYFLSALASVAEFPNRIKRNLLQVKESPKGAYCVALCITGAWIPYVIDDIFPVRPDGMLPFCYTENHEIWAMLFEKAYAKAYGAYWHIGSGGMSANALKDLTGAPCHYIDLNEEAEEATALDNLVQADKKNFIIACGSRGSGEHKNPLGIISGHAYTLAGCYDIGGTTLLKLRNPWGKGEWKGDWGDNSNLWTPQLKNQVGWTSEDDGTFYMTYQDFRKTSKPSRFATTLITTSTPSERLHATIVRWTSSSSLCWRQESIMLEHHSPTKICSNMIQNTSMVSFPVLSSS
jgi:hypothetical protein